MNSRNSKKASQRSRVGLIIALLLVASATVRLFGGTAAAIAREVDAFFDPLYQELGTDPVATPDILNDVLRELDQRRQELDQREALISERKRSLEDLSRATEAKLQTLIEAENSLRETISIARNAANSDITQLVSVYENMKPKDAALIFEEMQPSFAAGFLSRMRADSAAKIVQGLKPETAYSISVVLAGRNLGVPTE